MAASRRTTRRTFLKTGAAGLAALAAPRGFGATPDLKLKKPIKVGCQTILSGPLGGYGEFMKKGALLAMEEINAQDGIGGSPIELNFRDEELKVDVGVKNARYFVDDWGADFLIGIDSSAVALAVGEIMPSLNRILIVTHGATEKFNEDLVFKRQIKQCFRISVPVYQDGIASAIVAKDLPVKKWATISPDYEYGKTSWKMFRATIKKLKPEVEFVAETFMCPMGAAMDVLQGLGADYPDGAWASGRYYFLYPESAENRRFVEAFRKKWNSYPSYVSETSYAALHAIKKAVEKAKTLDIDHVIEALEGLEVSRPAGPCVIRKEDNQAVYTVPWGRIRHDPKYPMPILGDLRVIPTSEYYRKPPFPPVEA